MQTKVDRAAWLKGGEARCNVQAIRQERPHRLVLLGAPGVGKGTQAELLSAELGACHLSTGDVFRTAKALSECERSPAMSSAMNYMREGKLVPDDTVLSLVAERAGCLRCGGGFLLDGFPRTVAQAEALDKLLISQKVELEAVINYELPLEELVARLSGRRTCSKCKAVFHLQARPPKQEGICDQCGGTLFQREDDRTEAIVVRMQAYQESTLPLVKFYKRKGLLANIAANDTPEKLLKKTLRALKRKNSARARAALASA